MIYQLFYCPEIIGFHASPIKIKRFNLLCDQTNVCIDKQTKTQTLKIQTITKVCVISSIWMIKRQRLKFNFSYSFTFYAYKWQKMKSFLILVAMTGSLYWRFHSLEIKTTTLSLNTNGCTWTTKVLQYLSTTMFFSSSKYAIFEFFFRLFKLVLILKLASDLVFYYQYYYYIFQHFHSALYLSKKSFILILISKR